MSNAGDIPDAAIVGFYHKGFSQIVVDTSLWAMYLVLFPISLRALFRNRVWSRGNIYLGLTTVFMFTVTNIYFFIFLRLQTSIVEVMIKSGRGALSNAQRLELAADGIKGSRVIEALPRLINFILGDGVVVHRAYVIAGVQLQETPVRVWFLRMGMIAVFLASIAVSIWDFYLSIHLGTASLEFALTGHSNQIPDILAITLSFTTNLFATLSIGLTARRQILSALTLSSPKPLQRVMRLLVLLTETAVIYCIMQFVAIVILAAPAQGADATDIATGAYMSALNFLSALYPTVLIIIFSRQSGSDTTNDMSRARRTRSSASSGGSGTGVPRINVRLTSIPESLTYPSKLGQSTSAWTEDDDWRKARGSYTNFAV